MATANEHAAPDSAAPFMSQDQLAQLGGGLVAYVKPILSDDVNKLFPQAPALQAGLKLFALLNADGSPIMLTDSRDAAVAGALQNELQMASVH